jgi:predicted nucleotidyltransferase component of viral defense system
MADGRRSSAASIRQRLLDIARAEGRVHEVVLVRYALERLLYRLSRSAHRDRFALKGGMLVTRWIEGGNRETRDADFLGFGESAIDKLRATFAEIMAKPADDALEFDVVALRADQIREGMDYEGVRLRTSAYLEKTRIPVTVDIGFGDAVAPRLEPMNYPSLLGMEEPSIQAYPPAAVIAEKLQAMVALGMINGRMKDYHDLWAIPRALHIRPADLDAAIAATFERRRTAIPTDRPEGLSRAFVDDVAKQRQWRNYADSLGLQMVTLAEVVEAVWELVGPSCVRLTSTSTEG